VTDSLAYVTTMTSQLQSIIKGEIQPPKPRTDVARGIPGLIAKLIVDYD